MINYKTAHVNVSNFLDVNYLHGNAITDGSIRLKLHEGDDVAHIELRKNGVWNDTSFRFDSNSIFAGRDLTIGAAGDFVKTKNNSGFSIHATALLNHIPFSDDGTDFPHTPILDVLRAIAVFETQVSEVSGTTLSQEFTLNDAQIINDIIFQVGSIGATDEVEFTVYQGIDNTGTIISRSKIPASDVVANSELKINFDSSVGFSSDHVSVFVEFTSNTAFSLNTDASGNILISLDSQTMETRDLIYDDLLLTDDLELIFDEELGLVYHDQF